MYFILENVYISDSSSDPNCTNGVKAFWIALHDCVSSPKEWIAVICGMLAIILWVVQSMPQIIQNCKTGFAHEAVSLGLLFSWLFGDSCNMIGSFLTNQLKLQVISSVCNVLIDIFMTTQYIVALCIHRRRDYRHLVDAEAQSNECSTNDNSTAANHISPDLSLVNTKSIDSEISSYQSINGDRGSSGMVLYVFLFCSFSVYFLLPTYFKNILNVSQSKVLVTSAANKGRQLLSAPAPPNIDKTLGIVLGSISTACYLIGRLPQIYKNWIRKSVEGLSLSLFLLGDLASIAYCIQILLTSTSSKFIMLNLAWLIGSFGTLLLDIMIIFQFIIYRNRNILGLEFEV